MKAGTPFLLLVILLLAGGCGTGIGELGRTRSDVFRACNSGEVTYTAGEVDTLITLGIADYDSGVSKTRAILDITDACARGWGSGTDLMASCVVCGTAAINYIWD